MSASKHHWISDVHLNWKSKPQFKSDRIPTILSHLSQKFHDLVGAEQSWAAPRSRTQISKLDILEQISPQECSDNCKSKIPYIDKSQGSGMLSSVLPIR